MKRCHCLMFLLLMGMSFPGLSWAQDVINYKMLVNDPTLVPTSYIDIVYFDYEGSMANQNKWHKAVNGLGSSVIA
ncbi:MAG TPA: hypothetical protein ENJ82_11185, partial [Bacteroidetes bacterium]|nr:hypothetical protein [Bacteroidota bacterium]